MDPDQYQLGKSKVFIKASESVSVPEHNSLNMQLFAEINVLPTQKLSMTPAKVGEV